MLNNFYKKNLSLLKDNFVLFLAGIISGACSFIFHFYMGRTLGPSDYGVLSSLVAFTTIIIIGSQALQIALTSFVSNFKVSNSYGKISFLFWKSIKKMGMFGVLVFFAFIILAPFFGAFLHIGSSWSFVIIGIFFILAAILPVNRAVLQGLQEFKWLGWNNAIEGLAKLGVGILLVMLGFGVNGALLAFPVAFLVSFLFSFIVIFSLTKKKQDSFDTKPIFAYSYPILLALVSLTLFHTVDVFLVKHFFSNTEAGLYSAVSILGKIIFYASISVSLVMFPKVTELAAKKKETKGLLYKSLLIVLLIGAFITLAYFIFPSLIISILFGNDYLSIKPLIGRFGVVMTLFSVAYLISFYYMALFKTKFVYLLFLLNIAEVALIYFFHGSLISIIYIMIAVTALLLLGLFFFPYISYNSTFKDRFHY